MWNLSSLLPNSGSESPVSKISGNRKIEESAPIYWSGGSPEEKDRLIRELRKKELLLDMIFDEDQTPHI
jgi:hypothetical protein